MYTVLIKEFLILVGILSLGPLSITCIAGLFISIIQTATQIQEQSISFFAKTILLALMILVGGGFAAKQAIVFTQRVLSTLEVTR